MSGRAGAAWGRGAAIVRDEDRPVSAEGDHDLGDAAAEQLARRLDNPLVAGDRAPQQAAELGCIAGAPDTTMLMGMGVAIPHGTNEAKDAVRRTGVVLQQYPEGVDFDGEKAYLLFGIAGKGEEHLEVLAAICKVLEDEEVLERMKTTDDVAWIVEKLNASK